MKHIGMTATPRSSAQQIVPCSQHSPPQQTWLPLQSVPRLHGRTMQLPLQ